jgi:hypothetical protein
MQIPVIARPGLPQQLLAQRVVLHKLRLAQLAVWQQALARMAAILVRSDHCGLPDTLHSVA